MAQRYGGKFSPNGGDKAVTPRPSGWNGASRSRVGARANALFLAPAPLLFTAFGQDPFGLGLDLAAFAVLMAAAFMTREGLRAEEAYDARQVARRPALPRKIIGSCLTGLGLALAGLPDPAAAVVFALLGAGLHFLAFGPDPLTNKGLEGVDQFQTDRVARAVDEAESYLGEMADAIRRAEDRALSDRVARFSQTARGMFRMVEEDPRDLTGARRWLGVYLLGARDATIKFADLYARSRNTQAKTDYVALLDELEDGFAQRTQKMLLDDRSDLDVEIEVLRDRLQRETLPLKTGMKDE